MSNTTRIAKNTIFLYLRQILIMLVSLYTVRIVLNVLGAEDYGIYNVVAGVVVMFSFVNNAMASGTQRYINYYLGKNDVEKINQVYSSSLLIHFMIAIVFVVFAETIGLWFTNCKLNIPLQRHNAALIVYQFSILITFFSIIKVPYNAVIIAYEKMSFFAILSIIEALLKLVIVYALVFTTFDKLIFYAFLLTLVSIIITICYKTYCNKNFQIAHYKKVKNFSFVKEILGFSGWSLLGATADVANSQGTNIVLNLFTTVTVNAAMGIANQVNTAVYSFVSNFQLAFQPQIIKSYAENDKIRFINLICSTSKISFILLSFITVPLLINCETVLKIWLKEVPQYSVIFVQLTILVSLVSAWNAPLWMSIQATGNIKKYQIIVSCLIFANLPLSILFLYLGVSPECVLFIKLILGIITMIWRLFFLRKRIDLPVIRFFKSVLGRCLISFVFSFVSAYSIGLLIKNTVAYFFVTCVSSVFFMIFYLLIFGLDKNERIFVKNFFKTKLKLRGKNE